MTENSDFKKFLNTFWGCLSWVALSCCLGLSYIGLQTVSKPYWQAGKQVLIGNDRYETIIVVNPGPWKTRHPVIEFQSESFIHVIDSSSGVSVDTKENKIYAHTDEGLPAGCFYFITFKSAITNEIPIPKVTCEGKSCKDTPTFDLDLTLTFLSVIMGACILITAFCVILFIRARIDLRNEKIGVVALALEKLLIKMTNGGEEDVKASASALAEATKGLTQVMQHIHSQPVTKPVNKKKGGA